MLHVIIKYFSVRAITFSWTHSPGNVSVQIRIVFFVTKRNDEALKRNSIKWLPVLVFLVTIVGMLKTIDANNQKKAEVQQNIQIVQTTFTCLSIHHPYSNNIHMHTYYYSKSLHIDQRERERERDVTIETTSCRKANWVWQIVHKKIRESGVWSYCMTKSLPIAYLYDQTALENLFLFTRDDLKKMFLPQTNNQSQVLCGVVKCV